MLNVNSNRSSCFTFVVFPSVQQRVCVRVTAQANTFTSNHLTAHTANSTKSARIKMFPCGILKL